MEKVLSARSHLTFEGRPARQYYVGDSHVLIYTDLLFREHATGRAVLTRSVYLHGIEAVQFSDSRGTLSPRLLDALEAYGLLSYDRQSSGALLPAQRARDYVALAVANLTAERDGEQPPIAFSCGEIDARAVAGEFADAAFDVPHDPELNVAGSVPVPYCLVIERIERRLAPFERGLTTLASIGFGNLHVLAIPPPTSDDAYWERFTGNAASVQTRNTIFALFNEMLARLTNRVGANFVDLRPLAVKDNRRDPAYDLDKVHLNREAAEFVVRNVAERGMLRATHSS